MVRTAFLSSLALFAALPAGGAVLVDFKGLKLEQIQARAFTLPAEQTLAVHGVTFQPSDVYGDLARIWILAAGDRRVVWNASQARLTGRGRETRAFDAEVRLPAGDYEAYFATFPSNAFKVSGDVDWWEMVRNRGVDLDDYRAAASQLRLTIEGTGSSAALDPTVPRRDPLALVTLAKPGPNARLAQGFALARPAEVRVECLGELSEDGRFDYGWILDTATRRQVWSLGWANSEPAGGARKNRRAEAVVRLPAGKYAAMYVSDDSHGPGQWNSQPPDDPSHWGLSVRLRSPEDRAIASTFDYREPTDQNVILALTRVGNGQRVERGFTLKEPMAVRVYAIGEGLGGAMVDYGWIVDARTRAKVWVMRYGATDAAGGAAKNRVADTVLQLPAGSYIVYFSSDDSHGYGKWNASPPADREHWGITVYGLPPSHAPAKVAPYRDAEAGGQVLAQIQRVGDDEHEQRRFSLDRPSTVRIVAMGEGRDNRMFDYGWIEDSRGRPVWEMSYRATEAAGGAAKNRLFQGSVRLNPGQYTAHYVTDDSHAFADWNDTPPRDPDGWGMTVWRVGD